MNEIKISTNKKIELIDITRKIKKRARKRDGLINVFTPHSTAAILITENEPNLKKDWVDFLQSQIKNYDFLHDKLDDNAGAHILSGLIGQQKTMPLNDGPDTGTWQQIFLVELDGPRKSRKVKVTIIND